MNDDKGNKEDMTTNSSKSKETFFAVALLLLWLLVYLATQTKLF